MSASMKILRPVVISQSNPKHTAALIFLHGSCDTGPGVLSWVQSLLHQNLVFKHVRMIYPTAPERPYTAHNGRVETVWFDRTQVKPSVPEVIETVDSTAQMLNELIDHEVMQGIPKSNIVIGGFSMGASMALHMAYRHHQDLGGCFAMSGFLSRNSQVYEAIKKSERNTLPSLFMCHGSSDPLVMYDWGEATAKSLKELGIRTEFHKLQGYHELKQDGLLMLKEWILKVIPTPS